MTMARLNSKKYLLLAALFVCMTSCTSFGQTNAYIRINQAGYLPADTKIAIAFSKTPLRGDFVLRDNANRVVFRGPLKSVAAPNWGANYPHYVDRRWLSFALRPAGVFSWPTIVLPTIPVVFEL